MSLSSMPRSRATIIPRKVKSKSNYLIKRYFKYVLSEDEFCEDFKGFHDSKPFIRNGEPLISVLKNVSRNLTFGITKEVLIKLQDCRYLLNSDNLYIVSNDSQNTDKVNQKVKNKYIEGISQTEASAAVRKKEIDDYLFHVGLTAGEVSGYHKGVSILEDFIKKIEEKKKEHGDSETANIEESNRLYESEVQGMGKQGSEGQRVFEESLKAPDKIFQTDSCRNLHQKISSRLKCVLNNSNAGKEKELPEWYSQFSRDLKKDDIFKFTEFIKTMDSYYRRDCEAIEEYQQLFSKK